MGRIGPMGPIEVRTVWGGPTEVKTEGGSGFDRAVKDNRPYQAGSLVAEEAASHD